METVRLALVTLRRTFAQPGLVLTQYVVNLLFAVPLASALHMVLNSSIGGSAELDTLLSRFDFLVFSDALRAYGDRMIPIGFAFWAFAWAYIPIATFLTGGILKVLREESPRYSLSLYLFGCAEYFGRFLRLLTIFLAAGFLLVILLIIGAGIVVNAIRSGADSEIPVGIGVLVSAGVLAVIVALLLMTADYAKVIVVETSRRSMLRVALEAVRFVAQNFGRVVGLSVSMYLVVAAGAVLYWLFDSVVGMTSTPTILLMVAVQQMFVLVRLWLRTALFGAELALYRENVVRMTPSILPPGPSEEPAPLLA
jgi:hypothetical protein